MGRSFGWRRALVAGVAWALLAVAASACEKDPREKLLEATTNLQRETKLDESEKLLEEVLEAQPDNLEAKRLRGEVYQLRGEYKRAEEQLEKLWSAHNFDDARADRSARLKSARELLRNQFVDLYTDWAEELDPSQQPDKFVDVVRRGLDYDPKDMQLNGMLVDFYWNRGQRLVEAGNKKEAAEAFEHIQDLRTMRGDDRRERARKKARDLRLEFFKDEGRERFESKGTDTIAELDGLTLSEEDETIVIDLQQDVDYRLDPDDESDTDKARQLAFIGLVERLRALTIELADLPDDADLGEIGQEQAKDILLSKVEFEEKAFRPGRYIIQGRLSVEEAIEMAYELKTAWKQRTAEDPEDGEGGSEGSPAGGDAGHSPDATAR